MKTEIYAMSPQSPDDNALLTCAGIIRSGGLVAFPTETVYGLGADAQDPRGAKKIYSAKGRPSDNPLIIHVARPEDAESYAVTSPLYYRLASAFMPGPLTVILKKKDTIPPEVTGGLDTVAVRCPSHPIARRLIELSGCAIAAPSANLSGSPSPTCAAHVFADMQGRIPALIDGGECDIGLESTIVSIAGDLPILLRPGAVTDDALRCVCEDLEISPAVVNALKENERPLSPGMKYRHYAPSSPLILISGEAHKVLDFFAERQRQENCLVLCYDEELSSLDASKAICIGACEDMQTQAKLLFSALRRADERACEVIYAHLPPKNGLGLALYNRMIRAAAHTVREI